MSVDEIAAHLGAKRDTVYKWMIRKGLPAHQVVRLWKFRKPEVDAWVRSGRAAGDDSDPGGLDDDMLDRTGATRGQQ